MITHDHIYNMTTFLPEYSNSIEKLSVRFASQKTVTKIDSCYNMDTSEKDDTWYNREEIEKFREDVRARAKFLKKSGEHAVDTSFLSFRESLERANTIVPYSSVTRAFASSPESIKQREITRGLEHKIDIERPKNKYIARLAVLEAQRRLKLCVRKTNKQNSVIHLSLIASKFSRWAKEIALAAGEMDASDAYPTTSNLAFGIQSQFEKQELQKAPRKKARTGMNSARLVVMNTPIAGEEILRRKNDVNLNQ